MKKAVKFIRDCVELYIPIIAFLIMFVVFVIEIAARYIFNNPLAWAYEVTVMCYLWMVVFGACYAYRDRSHVTFTLVYDKLGIKGKAWCAFLGNVLMLIAYVVMFVPSCRFIMQMKIQETSKLHIGLNIVYLPFIPFMVIIILYILQDIWTELQVITGKGGQEAIDKMLGETRNEVQETIDAANANAAKMEAKLAEEKAKEGKR